MKGLDLVWEKLAISASLSPIHPFVCRALTKGDSECASCSDNFHVDVDVIFEGLHVPATKI
jgi:hypothetical protein